MDPSDLSNAAAGATLPSLLASFVAGYVVVLATPGPNMLVIGGIAAPHGLRRAPLLYTGAALRVGGLLLGYVAIAIACQAAPQKAQQEGSAFSAIGGIAAFSAGFCTAATNPLTGTSFAAQFLGPLNPEHAGRGSAWAIAGVVVFAFLFFLDVTSLLSRPSVRGAALVWHCPVRIGAAALFAFMAVDALRPVLAKQHSCRAQQPWLGVQRPCQEISTWPQASTHPQTS